MRSPSLHLLLPALILLAPAAAMSQDAAGLAKESAAPREKIVTLLVYGADPCPRSSSEEIVVCSRLPEEERYRIPKSLRRVKPKAQDRSWSDRVQMLEMVGRSGLPNSCSPSGSGGQTGCMAKFLREAREEREQARREGPDAD